MVCLQLLAYAGKTSGTMRALVPTWKTPKGDAEDREAHRYGMLSVQSYGGPSLKVTAIPSIKSSLY